MAAPVTALMSRLTAAFWLPSYCQGASKWDSSSFWELTQEGLSRLHAFSVLSISPTQSEQAPVGGEGGGGAAGLAASAAWAQAREMPASRPRASLLTYCGAPPSCSLQESSQGILILSNEIISNENHFIKCQFKFLRINNKAFRLTRHAAGHCNAAQVTLLDSLRWWLACS